MKRRIGLLGCGTLGRIFLELLRSKLSDQYEAAGIFDKMPEYAKAYGEEYGYQVFETLEELLAEKPDMVVEFASVEAVREYGPAVLDAGIPLVVASVGAFADEAFLAEMKERAERAGARIYVASGAIGGFDVMRTLALEEGARVTIVNRKAPESLAGAPFLEGKTLSDTEETLVFGGNALEAIQAFPKNVNVAVAAATAVAGPKKARVEVWSVPGLACNTHVIHVENSLAQANMEFASMPDPQNPRSSVVAAWSAAALLANLASPLQFF